MDFDLAYSILKLAMDTPSVVDNLWLAHESHLSDKAQSDLIERLGWGNAAQENIKIEIRKNASDYLDFLWYSNKYPSNLLDEAINRFPPMKTNFVYEIPSGFQPRWNPIGWIEKRLFSMKVKLCPPGQRIPSLIIYKPVPTTQQFPWQQAIKANSYLRKEKHLSISSRYVNVAGTPAYEFCFRSQEIDWWEVGQSLPLEYAMVPLIVEGRKECRLMLSTRTLAIDKSFFDHFINSFQ